MHIHNKIPAPPGDVELALGAMMRTAAERREEYGDNWRVTGCVLCALFPAGLSMADATAMNQFAVIVQIVNKLARYCASGMSHEDSAHDIGPYAAQLVALHKKEQSQ